jgi:heme/copper-type cytochrome/quinol oxidase subunit 4
MRHQFRVMAILAVCLAAYGVLLVAFHWTNQPRDSAVCGGLGLMFASLFVVPVVVRTIWRNL